MRTTNGIEADYDEIADVLHITFVDSPEPSYGHNVDDVVVILRGLVSDVMLGLEVLDVKRHGIERIHDLLVPIMQEEKQRMEERYQSVKSRIEDLESRSMEDLVPA